MDRRGFVVLPIILMTAAVVGFLAVLSLGIARRQTDTPQATNASVSTTLNANVAANTNVNATLNVNAITNSNLVIVEELTPNMVYPGWETYKNDKYHFYLKYEGNPFTKPLEENGRTRIQNYDSSKDQLTLQKEEWYIEVFYIANTDTGSCKARIENPRTRIFGNVSGWRGDRQPGGDAGGQGVTGCVELGTSDIVVTVTGGDADKVLQNSILNTLTFLDETAGWKTYTNSQYAIQLKHPTDWTAKTFNDPYHNGKAILSTLQNPGFQEPYGAVGGIFINVYANNNISETLDDWFAKNREVTEQKKQDRVNNPCAGTAQVSDMITEVSNDTVGGLPTKVQYEKALKPTYCEGGASTTKEYFVKKGTIIFEVTASSPTSSEADALIPVFDQVMDSLTFLDDSSGWKTYTNNTYGFSFKYPTNQSTRDLSAGNQSELLIGVGPTTPESDLIFYVEVKKDTNVDEVVDQLKTQNSLSDRDIVNESVFNTVAKVLTRTVSSSQGGKRYYVFSKKSVTFVIYYPIPHPTAEQNPNVFSTFTFLDATGGGTEFDIKNAKAGDKVAGMIIQSVSPFSTRLGNSAAVDNAKVVFTGQVTLTGTYHNYQNDGLLHNIVCVDTINGNSKKSLPLMQGDDRTIWFCFTNTDTAKRELSPEGSTGTVTVTIDNYTINSYPSEVWNSAELISAVR